MSTLDIQATTFKLLQQDNLIDPSLTLKECFRTYINPNTIDFDNPTIWDKLYNNEVLSVFQWDAASGRKGILAAHPETLAELTALNGLIRLMTQEGEEDQVERFCRIKANPESFEQEMINSGVNEEQRHYMHEMLDQFNGCAATQESFMVLCQQIAGYTLKQADALRKTVAKKKMAEITKQKELFYSQCQGEEHVKDYLWKIIVAPSLGYGFSSNHALPYSIIGVQCLLMGGILFNPIEWQTACLLQRSGALSDKSADYNKIAKAVALLTTQGVHIVPININASDRNFKQDIEKNIIYFGLEGVKGVKSKVIEKILELRPFISLQDFIAKTGADVSSIVALVKSGAFDQFGDRQSQIEELCELRADKKEALNGRNLQMISREGLWPHNTPELILAQRVVNADIYIKKISTKQEFPEAFPKETWYFADNKIVAFLEELDFPIASLIETQNGFYLDKKLWAQFKTPYLIPIKEWLKDNQEEMLKKVNTQAVQEVHDKYFDGDNLAIWEIETMGVCFREHPYAHVSGELSNFEDLPTEPQIATMFRTKTGHNIPLYQLTMIAGIAIAKDKLHSSITILTPTGPVDVKFRKEQFASYDAQISQQVGDKKKIIERSWFNRGCGLIIHGMRQDDIFVAKTYKNSPMKHTCYKILGIKPDGKFEVQKERKKGISEEDNTDNE